MKPPVIRGRDVPAPVVEVDWCCGADGVGVTVRPGGSIRGLARPGRYGTEVYWSKGYEPSDDEPGGIYVSHRELPGDAASPEAAAYRGLALLSARGRWSADLRDYVLGLAREASA